MRGIRLAAPSNLLGRLQVLQYRAECGRSRIYCEIWMVDPAEFFGAGMHMYQLDLRLRNIEHAVALRGHLAEATTDQQQKVGVFHAGKQFRIRPDAKVTGIARMCRVKEVTAPECCRHRQREPICKAHECGRCGLSPAAAADERHRTLGLSKQV